mmetsp:Transcript_122913/g.244482  ORF Transcript_122913/g.244482 Transcript_122913/m.244482 type:complete len:805 (+) Transcript_122913:91-2505(+)|eukprot:CAMPEP_0172659268 /NCGR_PEP_ID=MMETSP1074-20121228/3315_1 /TAXON_ID=2916 /ORGANISM="Ceratium fusus, Strain PA161109" /LENGTH=804 /DNA_ID=CAMNT_0013474711 /DNA_START=92 /DNA_END=2506 /DNA_ORIENTATION=+
MARSPWKVAFEAVRKDRNFSYLGQLFEESNPSGINTSIEWDGAFLTPLFVATLLRLDDHLPQLLAAGADASEQCLYDGLLCCPIHVAALRKDSEMLRAFINAQCDVNVGAETSAIGNETENARTGFTNCNVLHLLVVRDIFSEEVFRLLLQAGVRLSLPCRPRESGDIPGLLLPSRLGNTEATETSLDRVIGEEVKYLIRTSRNAEAINAFLEMGASFKREHRQVTYRFVSDIDFSLCPASAEEPPTALLYAADVGNGDAVRLLLYAGADVARTVSKKLPFDHHRVMEFPAQAVHLAVIHANHSMLEQLLFFGISPATECCGLLRLAEGDGPVERWEGLSLVHFAVLAKRSDVVPLLLKLECNINAIARRQSSDAPEKVPPLLLAILLGDVRCTALLLDSGATVFDEVRTAAIQCEAVSEMFGGPSVVGLADWLEAVLTSEAALQQLIDRRTDLSRPLSWPESSIQETLGRHRLASPELVARLIASLEKVPTKLQNLCPVHLACMLQQPWAFDMLAAAGAPVADATPCYEVVQDSGSAYAAKGLSSVPLDVVSLCVRVGNLQMLEHLCSDPKNGLDIRRELPLIPDVTPPFFPFRAGINSDMDVAVPLWAWHHLAPLELALLHRRVDVAVLLVRLGADLLHTVDHVAVEPPSHYSVTDMCVRGLTPLHLCALLDLHAAAAALLNEASSDGPAVAPEDGKRPRRKDLLSASCCTKAWATVESGGDPEKEPWLWRNLTPLHLAILSKSYGVAELLVEVSTQDSLSQNCLSMDVSADCERTFSSLLLAFEHNLKDLHRKIAKKFPTC